MYITHVPIPVPVSIPFAFAFPVSHALVASCGGVRRSVMFTLTLPATVAVVGRRERMLDWVGIAVMG